MKSPYIRALVAFCFVILIACSPDDKLPFTKMTEGRTNVDFENTLVETMELNVFTYDYLYNGAGVAAGDLNNDGLVDLYFTGNTVGNKLYLNEGAFEFQDITDEAGVGGKKSWATGVSLVDINGDGWLDIYVCYSGPGSDEDRAKLLFINNGGEPGGIPTFKEEAKAYGLDAPGTFTTQSSFFDYDLDGDLDMFLLNHGLDYHASVANAMRNRLMRHPQYGNRLYRNDSNKFVDVSEQAGIYGGWLNYGLSISVSDFNNDNFPDLYVSNDFDEQDYFYINNTDGTFSQSIEQCFPHISKFTMGTDIADFNNDNLPDIITLDMLPEDNFRQKLMKGPDDFDRYTYLVNKKYHRQHMRNMLHLNQGLDKNGLPVFSEIGQLTGISNTDWSWSPLFADLDNDGKKDLFITNGYLRDLTNLDFQRYDFPKARQEGLTKFNNPDSDEWKEYLFNYMSSLPSIKVSNYIFKNNGNLQFQDKTEDWGFEEPLITTGAAYADLDNDGDLDLITNNINDKAGVYRNNSEKFSDRHFIKIKLQGEEQNRFGIGAKVFIKTDHENQFAECYTGRGFLSSVDHALHFGVGKATTINEIKVVWPDNKVNHLVNIQVDTVLHLRHADAKTLSETYESASKVLPHFEDVTENVNASFVHRENQYVDFKHERLLLYQLSRLGPDVSSADVNKDGLQDFFVGGAAGQVGKLFFGQRNGSFKEQDSSWLEADKNCEDIASEFFDADGDHDLDLFVVSGGIEFAAGSPEYVSRLYVNNGKGIFAKAKDGLPLENSPGSCVASCDYDKDGDLDLFVGGGALPASYPYSSPSIILRNDSKTSGKPVFANVTRAVCPALENAGMITDAVWADVDRDGWDDLVVVGEWTPISIFKNKEGVLSNHPEETGLENTNGFWNTVKAVDLDQDGDLDLVAGNMGANGELNASRKEPLEVYVDDFDKNGKTDPLIFNYNNGVSYPIASRDDLLSQIPSFKKKFVRYEPYAKATVNNILDSSALQSAKKFSVYELATLAFENVGGKFKPKTLPIEVQFAPVQAIIPVDFNNDRIQDLLILGNLLTYRVEYGPFDANYGILLQGVGGGNFKTISQAESGLYIKGDVRDASAIRVGEHDYVVVVKNDNPIQIFKIKSTSKSVKTAFSAAKTKHSLGLK